MGMRGGLLARPEVKQSTITAVVTRADGTIENMGVVAYWHRNPLRRWAWALRQLLTKGR